MSDAIDDMTKQASEGSLPWEATDLFPPKPTNADYGYASRGRSVACTRDQLIDAVRRIDVPVALVWTPEAERLVPPEEVPFLFDAFRQRELQEAQFALNTARIHIVMWSVLFLMYQFAQRRESPLIFLILLLAFGIVPAFQAIVRRRALNRFTPADAKQEGMIVRYGAWLGTRRTVFTWVLGGLLIVVYLAQWIADARGPYLPDGMAPSVHAAGLVKQFVFQNNETWRLLTCTLMHGGLLHLGFNFLALLTLGRLIEVHAHRAYLPIVFLFAAICGSIASLYLGSPLPSVGASGGLMGLIGFLAVMGYRRKRVLPPGFLKSILLSIGFIVAIGLVAAQMIDNAAHLGGLFAGVALGLVYATRRTAEFRLNPSRLAIAAGGFCTVIIFLIAAVAAWKILRPPGM